MSSQKEKEEEEVNKKTYVDKRTPAQIAFDKMQEKRVSCSYSPRSQI